MSFINYIQLVCISILIAILTETIINKIMQSLFKRSNCQCNKDKIFLERKIDDNNNNNNLIVERKVNDNDNDNDYDKIIDKFVSTYNKAVNTPYIIGICGASGSGKTFIANLISKTIKKIFDNSECNDVVIISQDSYYIGGNTQTNYDIPSSIDFNLLTSHINQLLSGKSIKCPCYDFSTHSRLNQTIKINPTKIIIVEGILIFSHEEIRNLFNMKIFINAEAPTQIFRRTIRDINTRGRTIEEVRERYERDVWPSYNDFVYPSSKYADMVINNFNDCYVGPQIMLNHIITILGNICKK